MSAHPRPDIRVFADVAALAVAGAALFIDTARHSVAVNGVFTVALAGGATPRSLFAKLAESASDPDVPWSRMHFFWGDERHVPLDHPDSNARMAHEVLLGHVPVAPGQVHRIKGELPNPQDAAAGYEAELRAFFRLAPGAWPRFDLVMLGLGADGHTASLFPGTTATTERARLVVATRVIELGVDRVTLTAPVLNRSARVAFLVAGAGKAEAVAAVIQGSPEPDRYPAQLVQPQDGELIWLLDEAAASNLNRLGGSIQRARGPSGSGPASPAH